MAETVIGVFEQRTKAIKAVDNLLRDGFQRDAIDISSGKTGDDHSRKASDNSGMKPDRTHHTEVDTGHRSEHHHSESDDSINQFFDSLFGSGDTAREHTEVGRRGTIVTVHTHENDMSKKASAILDEHGSVDVRDHARHYRSETSRSSNSTDGEFGSGTAPAARQGENSQRTGVRSHIVGKQVNQDLRLRDEEVHESPYSDSDRGENSEHAPSARLSTNKKDTGNLSDVEDHNETHRNQVQNAAAERESIHYSDEEERRNVRSSSEREELQNRTNRPNPSRDEKRRNSDDYQAPTEAEQARYERERRRDQ
jgi:hypothetical protein